MKLFSLVILNLLHLTCLGQVTIVPSGLIDSTQSYFYIGVNNPVRVTGLQKGYIVSAIRGGASIEKVDETNFIIRVNSVSDSCQVIVRERGSGKIIAKRLFKVRLIPQPVFNWKDGPIKKEFILNNPILKVIFPNCFLNLDYPLFHLMLS